MHLLPETEEEKPYWDDQWKEMSIKFTKEQSVGAKVSISKCGKYKEYTYAVDRLDHWNNSMADWLEWLLNEAKTRYYKDGSTIMSDSIYDWLEGRLSYLRPKSKFLSKVGFDLED
jgi:hypothetical protein